MTRDKVLVMEAGRELDALVAEKVMGAGKKCADNKGTNGCAYWGLCWECEENRREGYFGWHPHDLVPWHYSTDIDAAWQVVEKMEQHPDEILFSCSRKGWRELEWEVRFRKCRGNQHDYIASAPTAPLAICRAALLTLGGSDELDW
jgi:hypothetical protein